MEELHKSNELDFILNTFDALVYVIDLESYDIIYANEKTKNEFGDVLNKKCFSVLQKDRSKPCKNCNLSTNGIFENRRNDLKWEHINALNGKIYLYSDKIVKWKDDRVVKIQVALDISKQKKLEHELHLEKDNAISSFEALSNATIEGLIIYDENKKCIKVNDVAPELLGYEKDEMIGMDALSFIAEESKSKVRKVIKNQNQEPYEAKLIRKDSSEFYAIIRGRDILLAGQMVRVSAVMDITAIKEKEIEISKLAYFDPLTSLPNRTSLKNKISEFMQKSQRDLCYGALMFIDLDHFKIINDTKGHLIGDKLLVECAKRLKIVVREYDLVTRFGGDEFVILIDTQTKSKNFAALNASTIAQKIVKAMKKTFYIEKFEFRISASIGIAIFKNHDISFDEIMKYADSAMYHAKENHRGGYSFFDPKLQNSIERKVLLTHELRKAIEKHRLEIYYQDQMDMNDNLVGIELLLRWNHKTLGFVSPVEFIPIAEESGLILKLGEYVLIEACKLLEKWKNDENKSLYRISVNISLIQFQRVDFVDLIKNLINQYQINSNTLRLEITESLLLKNADQALDKINTLKEMGVSISIDDFGTGYSSLSYLKKLPVDELKIDRSFIQDILKDESDEIIVNTILDLGKKFNFEVIAEGVESKEILEKLKQMNCKYFQGYYYGKPSSLDELK